MLHFIHMKEMLYGLRLVMSRKDGVSVIILSSSLFLFLLLLSQNGGPALEVFKLNSLNFSRQLSLATATIFDIGNAFTVSTMILATLGSLLAGINLALAYVYMKTRGELLLKSGLYSGIGLVLALLGIGCAACGTALLSLVLGFFGFSTMLSVFPYQGQEIGYIGLIFLLIATYFLSRKVSAPNVC
jgi:hypothetical protein